MLRTLGYPRLISLENFRSPNFPLVTEILVWLVKRFHPEYDISSECSTPEQRVLLIRSVAEFMVLKLNLKLNLKKLYHADGHAVKEMLKIASLLYKALKVNQNGKEEFIPTFSTDFSTKIQQLRHTRELSSQITQKGSSLFDLLSKEPVLREVRHMRSNFTVDVTEVETMVKNIINNTEKNVAELKRHIENISLMESSLDSKINKKENDLERMNKRLQTLKKVRPAFFEEFEQLEGDMNHLYKDYVIRFRCVVFLEQQLQQLHHLEEQKAKAANMLINDTVLEESHYKALNVDNPSVTVSTKEVISGISAFHSPKKRNHGRVRTATSRGSMYPNVNVNDDSINDDDTDETASEDEDDIDILDDVDSLLNNDTDEDESKLHISDPDVENSHLSDKSDDAF